MISKVKEMFFNIYFLLKNIFSRPSNYSFLKDPAQTLKLIEYPILNYVKENWSFFWLNKESRWLICCQWNHLTSNTWNFTYHVWYFCQSRKTIVPPYAKLKWLIIRLKTINLGRRLPLWSKPINFFHYQSQT